MRVRSFGGVRSIRGVGGRGRFRLGWGARFWPFGVLRATWDWVPACAGTTAFNFAPNGVSIDGDDGFYGVGGQTLALARRLGQKCLEKRASA